ncbi:MAG: hypothetical protein ACOCVJ_02570 [Verrucomicrobiota bacterium]
MNENETRPNYDGRHFGRDGEPDYFLVGGRIPKILYMLLTFVLTGIGVWFLWDPAAALLFGETGDARVTRLVREQPGEENQTIWFAREIKEQEHTVTFRHFVEVVDAEGVARQFRMGVDSRRKPYALPNDRFRVAYFPDGEYAFGIYHHRTWAFGAGFLTVGGILNCVAVFMVMSVGKKITIDPEDPEQLEAEERAVEEERRWREALAEHKKA